MTTTDAYRTLVTRYHDGLQNITERLYDSLANMDLSYQSMKIAHQAREADEQRTETRRKSLLTLIYDYLLGQGYMGAASALDRETSGVVRRFEVCDNIDLDMVLTEFESYQYVKYQKYPKLIRKKAEPGENKGSKSGGFKRIPCSSVKPLPKISKSQSLQSGNGIKRTASCPNNYESVFSDPTELSEYGLNISSIKNCPTEETAINGKERLLRPLSGFSGMSGEMRELAEIISRDIYLHSPNVQWDEIVGLENAKRLVKEAIVYPIKYPQLFTGILSSWKGLLLYGPPGTGKTLLAKAVATECKTTFFNISAPSIVSKWRGDSEKLVRVLFELARYHAPSTIFLDELESVMSQRGTVMGEHEGSRRMKAELLVQMDGLAKSDDLVFLLAASNLPWELDQAMLRRLEKRILVGLPSSTARQVMISHWLPPLSATGGVALRTDLDYETLAKRMDGYSGSDIRLVCKEAAMRQVRKIFDRLESHQDGGSDMPAIQLETITTDEFLDVISYTKPSTRNLMDRFTAWEQKYESV